MSAAQEPLDSTLVGVVYMRLKEWMRPGSPSACTALKTWVRETLLKAPLTSRSRSTNSGFETVSSRIALGIWKIAFLQLMPSWLINIFLSIAVAHAFLLMSFARRRMIVSRTIMGRIPPSGFVRGVRMPVVSRAACLEGTGWI